MTRAFSPPQPATFQAPLGMGVGLKCQLQPSAFSLKPSALIVIPTIVIPDQTFHHIQLIINQFHILNRPLARLLLS